MIIYNTQQPLWHASRTYFSYPSTHIFIIHIFLPQLLFELHFVYIYNNSFFHITYYSISNTTTMYRASIIYCSLLSPSSSSSSSPSSMPGNGNVRIAATPLSKFNSTNNINVVNTNIYYTLHVQLTFTRYMHT